jgi:hypothetical protein
MTHKVPLLVSRLCIIAAVVNESELRRGLWGCR